MEVCDGMRGSKVVRVVGVMLGLWEIGRQEIEIRMDSILLILAKKVLVLVK